MMQSEAIACANSWARDRFPIVPPIAFVAQLTPSALAQAERLSETPFPIEEINRYRGSWCVLFKCSWDTDAHGLPERLGVVVDDHTGAVEKIDM
jgi:hypothetical protein